MNLSINIRMTLMVLLVLTLSILPLPSTLNSFRPPWVLLLVLYVQFFLPNYFSLIGAFVLGLCLDVLLSTVLGDHAFAITLTTWIAASRVRRFHMFSLAQQMALIALLCFVYQLTLLLIDSYQGFNNTLFVSLGTTLISLMLWPWITMLLEKILGVGFRQRVTIL